MSEPAQLPKCVHYRNDIWKDGYRVLGPVTINGAPPLSPCLYARLQFRNIKDGSMGYELNSSPGAGQGTIIIDDPVNYKFTFPEQSLPLAAGDWECDFETYTTANHTDSPWTIWRWKLQVKPDITHD